MQIFHPEIQKNIKPRKLKVFFKWGMTLCSVKHKHNVWAADLLKVNYLSVELSSPFRFGRTHFLYGEIHHKRSLGFLLFKWGSYGRIYTKLKYTKSGKTNNNRRSKK
jgi:hypothetical protein